MNTTKNDVVDMEKATKYISKFDSRIIESRAKLLTVALVTQNEHQDCEFGNKSVECSKSTLFLYPNLEAVCQCLRERHRHRIEVQERRKAGIARWYGHLSQPSTWRY